MRIRTTCFARVKLTVGYSSAFPQTGRCRLYLAKVYTNKWHYYGCCLFQ